MCMKCLFFPINHDFLSHTCMAFTLFVFGHFSFSFFYRFSSFYLFFLRFCCFFLFIFLLKSFNFSFLQHNQTQAHSHAHTQNSEEVSDLVSEANSQGDVTSIKTCDLSTLYTNLPHTEVKERIPKLVIVSRALTRSILV